MREMKEDRVNGSTFEEALETEPGVGEDELLFPLEDASYRLFKLLTSKSEMDFAPGPPGLTEPLLDVRFGLPSPALPPLTPLRLEANFAARASGDGRIAQRGQSKEIMDCASGDLYSFVSSARVGDVRDTGGEK